MREYDSNFQLQNSAFISNLAQIKHVFIDKTRTMTTGEFDLIEIQIQNQVYEIINQDEYNYFYSKESPQFTKPSPPEHQIQIIQQQSNIDQFQKFVIDQDIEEEIEEDTPSKTSKTQTIRSRDIQGSQKNSSWTSKSEQVQKNENNQEKENQDIEELFEEQNQEMIDSDDKKEALVIAEQKQKKFELKQKQLVQLQLAPIQEESFGSFDKSSAISILKKNKKNNDHDLKKSARISKPSDIVYEALLSLILCHQANKQINSTKQTEEEKMWFENREELEIIRQAKEYGFVFEKVSQNKRRKIQYQVKVNGQKLIYEVLGINDFTENRKRFSMVLKQIIKGQQNQVSHEQYSTLYVKGSMLSIINNLELNEKYKEKLLENLKKKGQRHILYAKKHLTLSETEQYLKAYKMNKNKFTVQDEELNTFYCELEQKLQLVTVIGIQDKLYPFVPQTIEMFQDSEFRLWLVTGDCYEKAIATGYHSKLLPIESDQQSSENILRVVAKTFDEAKVTIRGHLSTLRAMFEDEMNENDFGSKSFQNKNEEGFYRQKSSVSRYTKKEINKIEQANLSLVCDGNTLNLLLKSTDQYLVSHFQFIIALCKNFLFYEMSALNKAQLVQLVTEIEPNKNKKLAIGDGMNDIFMMQIADFSMMLNFNKEKIQQFYADSNVSSWKSIQMMVYNIAPKQTKLWFQILTYSIISSDILIHQVFYTNILSKMHANSVYSSWIIFVYFNIVLPAQVL